MLSDNLQTSLSRMVGIAEDYQHDVITLEHLLLALCQDRDAVAAIRAVNGDITAMVLELENYLKIELDARSQAFWDGTPQPSSAVQRVIQRAVIHGQSAGLDEIHGGHILSAMYAEEEAWAVWLLNKFGIERLDILRYLSHGISTDNKTDETEDLNINEDITENTAAEDTALDNWCVNLNKKAAEGKIDPLIGRTYEVERCVQILCRRTRRNPLLVGEPGVGKTAIVEGLALAIQNNNVPDVIADATIWSLDLPSLLAGTKFRGDFEERIKKLLKELEKSDNIILFIDEIHTLIGAGATGQGAMDAANMLKPLLSKGDIQVIGATTWKEFRTNFEKDQALVRRFQHIAVNEPTQDEAVEILRGLKEYYEDWHNVRYADEAITSAVELSNRYIHERFLPDKAIDVLDEAGARRRAGKINKRSAINRKEIEDIVAQISEVPSRALSKDDAKLLQSLDENLRQMVYGQDTAIEAVASAIRISRAGLRDKDKTVGNYLFTGPTGVGKTEIAKQLSLCLGMKLIRFDMSEYQEPHSVARLIGSPPGYVGHDDAGQLTEAVRKNPHCVLLMDEIEKAHPDVYNILLSIMDYGKLTDGTGRTIDFRNAIVIMTSNAGAVDTAEQGFGFGKRNRAGAGDEAVKKAFTPEFRNRIDAIITFDRLGQDSILKIIDKFIAELELQLEEKDIRIKLSADARKWFAKNGFDDNYGARPMARLIQDKIKKPLASEILFGELKKGGCVNVQLDEKSDDITMEITPKRPQISKRKTKQITA